MRVRALPKHGVVPLVAVGAYFRQRRDAPRVPLAFVLGIVRGQLVAAHRARVVLVAAAAAACNWGWARRHVSRWKRCASRRGKDATFSNHGSRQGSWNMCLHGSRAIWSPSTPSGSAHTGQSMSGHTMHRFTVCRRRQRPSHLAQSHGQASHLRGPGRE